MGKWQSMERTIKQKVSSRWRSSIVEVSVAYLLDSSWDFPSWTTLDMTIRTLPLHSSLNLSAQESDGWNGRMMSFTMLPWWQDTMKFLKWAIPDFRWCCAAVYINIFVSKHVFLESKFCFLNWLQDRHVIILFLWRKLNDLKDHYSWWLTVLTWGTCTESCHLQTWLFWFSLLWVVKLIVSLIL